MRVVWVCVCVHMCAFSRENEEGHRRVHSAPDVRGPKWVLTEAMCTGAGFPLVSRRQSFSAVTAGG